MVTEYDVATCLQKSANSLADFLNVLDDAEIACPEWLKNFEAAHYKLLVEFKQQFPATESCGVPFLSKA